MKYRCPKCQDGEISVEIYINRKNTVTTWECSNHKCRTRKESKAREYDVALQKLSKGERAIHDEIYALLQGMEMKGADLCTFWPQSDLTIINTAKVIYKLIKSKYS